MASECEVCGQHERVVTRDDLGWLRDHSYRYAHKAGAYHDTAWAYSQYVVRECYVTRCYADWNHARRYPEWVGNYCDEYGEVI